jgi:hypothetical protein
MAEREKSANRRRRSDMTGPLFENTQLGKLRHASHHVQLMMSANGGAGDGAKTKASEGLEKERRGADQE